MKICPLRARSFHVDEWTDMTKLIATFCSFVNTPRLSGTINCYEHLANNKNLLSLLGIYQYNEAAI
jgi:hypothetical protein